MWIRITALLLALCFAVGCSLATLRPAVEGGAVEYSAAMDAFTNQALLTNVLRARDYAPLNFNDLSAVTGSFSAQVTAMASQPIPLAHAAVANATNTASVSPGFTYSVTPSITLGTLNTQGFIMTMIQPISTTYVLSKWNEGYDHRLLLYLFVKSIKFCDDKAPNDLTPAGCSSESDALKVALDEAKKTQAQIQEAQDAGNSGDLPRKQTALIYALNDTQMTEKALKSAETIAEDAQQISAIANLISRLELLQKAISDSPDANKLGKASSEITEAIANLESILKPINVQTPICPGPHSPTRVHLNSPDDPDAISDFKRLVDCLFDSQTEAGGNVDLKSLMVLDPLGNPLPFGETVSVVTPPSPAPGQQGGQAATPPIGAPDKLPTVKLNPNSVSGTPAPATYHVRITYVTNSGETYPSPERTIPWAPDKQTMTVGLPVAGDPPQQVKPPKEVIGYNVYLGTTAGLETRQNVLPISIDPSNTPPWPVPNNPPTVSGPLAPRGTQYVIATPGAQNTLAADSTIFSTINGLSDGQLHAGNAKCPPYLSDANLCPPPADSPSPYVQFYKEYPGQVVLCVRTNSDRFNGHVITPISESELENEAKEEIAKLTKKLKPNAIDESKIKKQLHDKKMVEYSANAAKAAAMLSTTGGKPSNPAGASPQGAGGAVGGGGGGAGASAGSTAGAMSQVTLALQPNRISAILDSIVCQKDQVVLQAATEEEFGDNSKGFAHVEWRSVAEVIQYLGAIARNKQNQPTWQSSDGEPNQVFAIRTGEPGRVTVGYGTTLYSVGQGYEDHPKAGDHSLQALALLNEMISIAKIAGNLPVSQPVQVLP